MTSHVVISFALARNRSARSRATFCTGVSATGPFADTGGKDEEEGDWYLVCLLAVKVGGWKDVVGGLEGVGGEEEVGAEDLGGEEAVNLLAGLKARSGDGRG